jgi:hypothetical protein
MVKNHFPFVISHFSFVIAGIHHARNQRRWRYNGGAPFRKLTCPPRAVGAPVPYLNGMSKTTRLNGATKRHAEKFLDQSQMENGKYNKSERVGIVFRRNHR